MKSLVADRTSSLGVKPSASAPFCRSLALSLAFVAPTLALAQTPAPSPALSPASAPAPTSNSADTDKELVKLEPLDITGARAITAVSSAKFTQPLIDTPQTIAVIPREIFNQQGATTLSDVLRNTPGITFTAGEGGNVASGDTFTMRGFDASGSIFIDGVRDTGAHSRDVYNLEQVEIAKGPAGADNGRGGTSGYVNLVSKTPTLEPIRTATVSYGSADQRRAAVDVSQPLPNDTVPGTALRLNLYRQDSGVPGRDEVQNTGFGLAPSLAFGLGTPTRLVIAASYAKQDNVPDSGLPVVALSGEPLLIDPLGAPTTLVPFNPSPAIGSVDQENFYGLKSDYDHITSKSILVRLAHDLTPDTTVTNQTKLIATDRDALTTYVQNSSTAPTTFSATTVPRNPATGAVPAAYTSFDLATRAITPRRIHNETENDILSNQTIVNTHVVTGPIEHDLGGGLDLTREQQFTPTWFTTGGPSTDLYNPNPGRPVTVAQTPYRSANRAYDDATIESIGLFVYDTIKLTPRLLVNGSVRRDRSHIGYTSLPGNTVAVPTPATARISSTETLTSWKVGTVFKPAKNGSLYAAYGNSFTPAGSTFSLSSTAGNQNNPNLEPQEARNTEIGVKWEFFDARLSTNLALYRSENFNVSTTDSVTNVTTQDAGQEVEGIEFGISGKITERWLVFGGVGYIDSQYHNPASSTANNNGSVLRYTPRLSGSLYTTYILPFKLTIGGGAQYTETVTRGLGTVQGSATNNTGSAIGVLGVPSYWVFNTLLAYEVTKNLSLRLNVNNVFDEDYFRLNNNGGRYYPGAPRSYVLSADFKF